VAHGIDVERPLRTVRGEIAVEVPGRVHEGVHGVRLAPRRAAAAGADGLDERGHLLERVATLPRERRVLRELDRELVVGYAHDAVLLAVDDRDRRSPVALPADEPVLETVRDRALADRPLLRFRGHAGDGLAGLEPIETVAVDGAAGAVVGHLHLRGIERAVRGLDHDAD